MTIWNKYKLIKEINSKSNVKTYIARIEPMIKEIIPKNREQDQSIFHNLKELKKEIKIYDIIEENDKIYVVLDNNDELSLKIDKLVSEENTYEKPNTNYQENSIFEKEINDSKSGNIIINSKSENNIIDLNEIEKSICKINKKGDKNCKDIQGIGFFCNFEINNFPIKYALFTSYNLLKKKDSELGKSISFNYLNTEKTIKLVGDRKIYTNEDLNYTCIEIFNSDNIKKFFTIKPYEEKKNYSKEPDIFTIQYKNNEISFSYGKIISIDDKKIIHNAISENKYYGSPIINKFNNSIIGLNYDIDKNNYLNTIGVTFDSILNDITSGQYSGIKKELIDSNKENIYLFFSDNNKKNEIYCTYNKIGKEIKLLYDYKVDHCYYQWEFSERIKSFNETKSLINSDNIELFVNQRKIKFNTKYQSDEIGDLKVKFKFNKLLTSTSQMFYECESLKSIDLSSLNISNVNDMSYMFYHCHYLESFSLSDTGFNHINDMSCMFYECRNLKTVNLNLYEPDSLRNLNCMFAICYSLETLDLSSFKVDSYCSMISMFSSCRSLKVLDLSSFIPSNSHNVKHIFSGCVSLKKENIKLHKDAKILKAKLKSCLIY